jgi:amino acid transporter
LQTAEQGGAALRSGVIGLVSAATLGTVMLSPAMTLYANFGAAYGTAGKAAPLAFVWGLLATLPTAASYALVARAHPQSGSAASWTALALSPRAARWVGWMVVLYYLTNFVLQPVTFGLFFRDLLSALGVQAGGGVYALGALLCCAVPAAIAYRGIAPSAHGALALLLFETVVVAALCITVAFFNPSRAEPLSAEGFRLSSAPGGLSGLWQAMIFAMLSYCGFDVVSTLAEEAKMARKLIPQATLLCLLLFGAFVIAGIWALTYALPPEKLRALAAAGGLPITEIARAFWGRGALLVTATGLSAALGIAIATAVGASRVLFAMGREGLAPAFFGKLHQRTQVPWRAMHLVFGAGLAGALVAGFLVGPYPAYLWWGTTSTFFAMVTFIFVNLSNLILLRGRALQSPLGFLLHAVAPVTGIAVDLYILYRSFFVELWAQPWATGKSVIAFDVACALLALAALWPRAIDKIGGKERLQET